MHDTGPCLDHLKLVRRQPCCLSPLAQGLCGLHPKQPAQEEEDERGLRRGLEETGQAPAPGGLAQVVGVLLLSACQCSEGSPALQAHNWHVVGDQKLGQVNALLRGCHGGGQRQTVVVRRELQLAYVPGEGVG